MEHDRPVAYKRVLIVSHQVVVLCFRYLIEKLDQESILAIDAEADVANCSVTEYASRGTREGDTHLRLDRYNFVLPLLEQGAPVTTAPDAKVAAR